MEGKAEGGSSPSGGSMGIWDEALKNQSALRNSMGLKNSRSSPSLRYVGNSPKLAELSRLCVSVFNPGRCLPCSVFFLFLSLSLVLSEALHMRKRPTPHPAAI